MTGALNECTASDLATEDVAALTADEVASAAIEWFTEHGYDAAPVVEGEQPIGHVEIDTLQDASDDETVREHARPITLEETISADATFRETLEALYDSPYYYLGGRNRVTGILTRADLNTSPAYIHPYDHIAVLERAFREVILDGRPRLESPRRRGTPRGGSPRHRGAPPPCTAREYRTGSDPLRAVFDAHHDRSRCRRLLADVRLQ